MTERPILFSAPMVRAILAGRKTQTRRALRIQPPPDVAAEYDTPTGGAMWGSIHGDHGTHCPYGKAGDRLWVRENGWQRPERTPKMMRDGADTWAPYYYDADIDEQDHAQFKEWGFKRRPSIHMPRSACRIALEVTNVRVERLQDITEHDAKAEGCEANEIHPQIHARAIYHAVWQSINGNWSANPWVWVVEFRRAALKVKA